MSVKLGNTDIAGTQVLYSTTGNNTDGAMTQAATTTALGLKANDTDVVHLAGTETITGYKTFKQYLLKQNDNITKGTAPSSNIYNVNLVCTDTDGKSMGMIELGYFTDKQVKMTIGAYNGNTSSDGDGGVYLELLNNNGTGYAKCPASDVNGSIVTTVNKSKNSTGYLQLGNGIILNWGYAKMTNDATTVMTFAKAFSGENNYGMAQGYWSPASGRQDPLTITAKTNTGFTVRNSAGSGTNYCFWVAIGY